MKAIEEATLDLETEWVLANNNSCCSCHKNPPCDFCVDGYSLECDEFVALGLEALFGTTQSNTDQTHNDYDRAMKGIGF